MFREACGLGGSVGGAKHLCMFGLFTEFLKQDWEEAGMISRPVGGTEEGLMQVATLLAVMCKHRAKVTMQRGERANGSHKPPHHGTKRRALVIFTDKLKRQQRSLHCGAFFIHHRWFLVLLYFHPPSPQPNLFLR